MHLIYYLSSILLLLVNVAGLTLCMRRWLPTFALARATGLLVLCLVLFFLEHFQGFGKLTWLWPFSTSAAIAVLYLERNNPLAKGFWRAECVFLVAFAYGFAWKWAFPLFYPSSERITDLFFIGNYLPGQTLPPLDNWFPPNRFDFYYAFQHYAAALMGRIFGFGPGMTCNIAFALLMSLPITLVWDFTKVFLDQSWKRWLVVITFVIGGAGISPFVHLSYHAPANLTGQPKIDAVNDGMWASSRFIGLFDQRLNTELGHTLFPKKASQNWEPRELPLEGFGYQFYVGDYHPPLGGFLLLMMFVASLGALEQSQRKLVTVENSRSAPTAEASIQKYDSPLDKTQFILQALLAFTVPLMIATNTWAFPLQVALMLGWILWRTIQGQPPVWKALLIGGGAGFLLLYPFLTTFAGNALPTPIKWVQSQDHTPVAQFLAMHWPLLLFGVLSFFARETRRIALMFAVVFLGLLLVSELIFVDDLSAGKSERTNTVMKWWGWIWSGGQVTLSTLLLASRVRWVQGVAITALLLVNWYAIDVVQYFMYTDKSAAGKLEGDNVYTYDPVVRDMFKFLQKAPSGVVLENNYGDLLTDSGIYSVFAVKPTLLGWPLHLQTWHGSVSQIWLVKEQIIQFYKGQLPDSANWLLAKQVQYIVWNTRDSADLKAWETINANIGQSYAWQEFQSDPSRHVGFWIRRKVEK